MIWTNPPEAKHGDMRIVEWFAWLPVSDQENKVTIWLERVRVHQTYRVWEDTSHRYWRNDKVERLKCVQNN